MDKIDKALKKLSEKEKEWVKSLLSIISSGNMVGLDIKKLKGRDDIFRVRKGDIRIIYRIGDDKKVFILAIDRRNDNTYNF